MTVALYSYISRPPRRTRRSGRRARCTARTPWRAGRARGRTGCRGRGPRSRQHLACELGPLVKLAAQLADHVGVIAGAVRRRVREVPVDREELARLVGLNLEELLEEPPAPRTLVI